MTFKFDLEQSKVSCFSGPLLNFNFIGHKSTSNKFHKQRRLDHPDQFTSVFSSGSRIKTHPSSVVQILKNIKVPCAMGNTGQLVALSQCHVTARDIFGFDVSGAVSVLLL